MLTDYHTHTDFSYDCNVTMETQCQAAVAAGIGQIAFTEHEENNPNEEAPGSFRHADYFAEVARCRERFAGQLAVRAGIEISEPHRYAAQTRRALAAHPWDVVLGSLHWVDEQTNTLSPAFFTRYGGWREAFRVYFAETLAMVRYGDFDVLAHLDYPARYVPLPRGDVYDIREFEREIRPVLGELIERGKGIEINTASLRRGLPDACPPPDVIGWYREMGGSLVTLGSDAHRAHDVGAHLGAGRHIAREAGFTHTAAFERRQASLVDLSNPE